MSERGFYVRVGDDAHYALKQFCAKRRITLEGFATRVILAAAKQILNGGTVEDAIAEEIAVLHAAAVAHTPSAARRTDIALEHNLSPEQADRVVAMMASGSMSEQEAVKRERKGAEPWPFKHIPMPPPSGE